MPESEAEDWVLVWVEDLHRRAGSKRFWEEEQERIDLLFFPETLTSCPSVHIFHPDQYPVFCF